MSFKVVPAGQANASQATPTPQPPQAIQEPVKAQETQTGTVPAPGTAIAANTNTGTEQATQGGKPGEAVKPADKDLAPQFADLARKESIVRKAATDLHAQRQEFARKQAEFEQSLAADPLKALAAKGITADKLLEALIASGATPPSAQAPAPQANPLEAQVKALQAELEALKKGSEQQVDSQYQAALKQIEKQAQGMSDKFPTIKAREATKDVVELIEKYYKASGEIMATEEAMGLIEAELIEEGLKWASLDTVKAKLTQPAAPQTTEAPAQQPATQHSPKKHGMPAKVIPRGLPANHLTNQMQRTKPVLSARDRAIAVAMGQDPDAL